MGLPYYDELGASHCAFLVHTSGGGDDAMLIAGLLYLALASTGPVHEIPTDPKARGTEPVFERGAPDDTRFHLSQEQEDEARRVFNDYARCMAANHERQAAAVLNLNYGSPLLGKATQAIVDLESDCFGPVSGTVTVQFDPNALIGGMSEYFILHPKEIEPLREKYPASFVWPAPTAMENFGYCVVDQGEASVATLIRTRVTTDQEAAAMQALAPALGQCVTEGQSLEVNVGALRQLLAVALYRRMAVPLPVLAPAASTAAVPASR
jgi:hypothetical protein